MCEGHAVALQAWSPGLQLIATPHKRGLQASNHSIDSAAKHEGIAIIWRIGLLVLCNAAIHDHIIQQPPWK
jgi:hypothetical protein